MRTIFALVCLTTALLLGGCISSDRPLLPGAKASFPLKDGTYVGGSSKNPEARDDTIIVKRKSDDYLFTRTEHPKEYSQSKEDTKTLYTVRFQLLDEGHYVAQLRVVDKTATPYKYVFVFLTDGVMEIYAAGCSRFLKSKHIMRAYDMIPKRDWPVCEAKSTDGLLDFMRDIPLVLKEITSLEYTMQPQP